jgi:hypothetical protein
VHGVSRSLSMLLLVLCVAVCIVLTSFDWSVAGSMGIGGLFVYLALLHLPLCPGSLIIALPTKDGIVFAAESRERKEQEGSDDVVLDDRRKVFVVNATPPVIVGVAGPLSIYHPSGDPPLDLAALVVGHVQANPSLLLNIFDSLEGALEKAMRAYLGAWKRKVHGQALKICLGQVQGGNLILLSAAININRSDVSVIDVKPSRHPVRAAGTMLESTERNMIGEDKFGQDYVFPADFGVDQAFMSEFRRKAISDVSMSDAVKYARLFIKKAIVLSGNHGVTSLGGPIRWCFVTEHQRGCKIFESGIDRDEL